MKSEEVEFLVAIANELESVVNRGVDIARRIGWDGRGQFIHLGGLYWAAYTEDAEKTHNKNEPDRFCRGIAPAVKLLHAVVMRIYELERTTACAFSKRWLVSRSAVYVRLWAASTLGGSEERSVDIGLFLTGLDDISFWRVSDFPEVAAVRAVYFGALESEVQEKLVVRLRKGPPRELLPARVNKARVKEASLFWTVRELRRIEVAGGELPAEVEAWLDSEIVRFEDLAGMSVEHGFPEGPKVRAVLPSPDTSFNLLGGDARLRALEKAMSSGPSGWLNSTSKGAEDWLMQEENLEAVLGDLESSCDGGDRFPRVWNRFGWSHTPDRVETTGVAGNDHRVQAERILNLLDGLSEKTLANAIDGISYWMYAWRKQICDSVLGTRVWLRIWPIAGKTTNARGQSPNVSDSITSFVDPDKGAEQDEIDTLNQPTGQLVSVFLGVCGSVSDQAEPFSEGSLARNMRDAAVRVEGRSRLIVLHRLIEWLPFFLLADQDWTLRHLISPLEEDNAESLVLWNAVARRTRFREVLQILGELMVRRVGDRRISRETRKRLAFSLVVESLHAFRESRDPAVANTAIQKMLRSVDDEIRTEAASTLQQFVHEMSTSTTQNEEPPTSASVFLSSAKPFLARVWPQERSLATPGISRALASLPAASGDAFEQAVDAIERFLVPFECLSMHDYGFDDYDGETLSFVVVSDQRKGKALLQLLDLTVSGSTGAMVPSDLADALAQIGRVAPELARSRAFMRLATAARR